MTVTLRAHLNTSDDHRRRTIYGLPDDLWRELKAAAALAGCSVSDYVTDALTSHLERELDAAPRPKNQEGVSKP